LNNGRLSLAQARAIAGQWKADRRAGRDPIAEWEARRNAHEAAERATRKEIEDEAAQTTLHEAVAFLASKQLAGKKSVPAMRYRLDRLVNHLGDRKLRISREATSSSPSRRLRKDRSRASRPDSANAKSQMPNGASSTSTRAFGEYRRSGPSRDGDISFI